jgi:hypothetical protein|eukprot:COSAG01_NODE_3447_length_6079_cov_12.927343_5_plen_81_part_00
MNHRTWGTRCIILVLSHTFCACYIGHRWPHSIFFFVIRFPVVLAKHACSWDPYYRPTLAFTDEGEAVRKVVQYSLKGNAV